MKAVTLKVASSEKVKSRALVSFVGNLQGDIISFATPELLWTVLTAKRWERSRYWQALAPSRCARRRVELAAMSRPCTLIAMPYSMPGAPQNQ